MIMWQPLVPRTITSVPGSDDAGTGHAGVGVDDGGRDRDASGQAEQRGGRADERAGPLAGRAGRPGELLGQHVAERRGRHAARNSADG